VTAGILGAIAVVITTAVAAEGTILREKLVALAINVNNWLTQVLAGESATDPTVFILFLGATSWATAFAGTFALMRTGRPWDALGFVGFCLVVNVSMALTNLLADLVVFTLGSLVLLVRLHIVALQERWQRNNIVPSGEMDWRLLRGGLTWALVLAAAICYIPANVLPVLSTTALGSSDSDTIMGGVVFLFTSGSWPLALIVLIASVMVPLGKLVALIYLLVTVQRGSITSNHERTRLYRMVEFIGRWSMLDVFVDTFTVALVQLQPLMSVEPGPGVLFFAAVVVLTNLGSGSSASPDLIGKRALLALRRTGGLSKRALETSASPAHSSASPITTAR